ncbi:hypothetical protein MRB53_019087 [Persea americana]|uniref:Uncharacterized protein n=1 Tax=Persea americana TaxID=3435 RepID=A0ACC2MAG0_PERAE|nr:hypothetical protein MRB53_019087 [Persea americana]
MMDRVTEICRFKAEKSKESRVSRELSVETEEMRRCLQLRKKPALHLTLQVVVSNIHSSARSPQIAAHHLAIVTTVSVRRSSSPSPQPAGSSHPSRLRRRFYPKAALVCSNPSSTILSISRPDSPKTRKAIDTIVVGVLHDVIDDTCENLSSIEEEFGCDVAKLVSRVSRLSYINQVRLRATTCFRPTTTIIIEEEELESERDVKGKCVMAASQVAYKELVANGLKNNVIFTGYRVMGRQARQIISSNDQRLLDLIRNHGAQTKPLPQAGIGVGSTLESGRNFGMRNQGIADRTQRFEPYPHPQRLPN